MSSILNPGALKSAAQLNKEAKEVIKKKVIKQLNQEPAGLENTCKFGKHNQNYNINSLKMW